jgi:phosphatidylglycerophosphatase A
MSNAQLASPVGERVLYWLMIGFGSGRARWAPGTWGTVVGVAIYLLLRPLPPTVYAGIVAALFAFGVWASGRVARALGQKDPSSIVWDEIVGVLVALFMAPAGWGYVVAGFLLFRLFDIAKPLGIDRLQHLPGGWGIMADDLLAGLYVAVALHGWVWWIR